MSNDRALPSNGLLNCPFCGAAAHLQETDSGFFYGECTACEATAPGDNLASDAIALWNRRAAPETLNSPPKNWAMWTCMEHNRVFAAHAGCSVCRENAPKADQRQLNQPERDAMNRAAVRSVDVIDNGSEKAGGVP